MSEAVYELTPRGVLYLALESGLLVYFDRVDRARLAYHRGGRPFLRDAVAGGVMLGPYCAATHFEPVEA
jgi:hypothetical protein